MEYNPRLTFSLLKSCMYQLNIKLELRLLLDSNYQMGRNLLHIELLLMVLLSMDKYILQGKWSIFLLSHHSNMILQGIQLLLNFLKDISHLNYKKSLDTLCLFQLDNSSLWDMDLTQLWDLEAHNMIQLCMKCMQLMKYDLL